MLTSIQPVNSGESVLPVENPAKQTVKRQPAPAEASTAKKTLSREEINGVVDELNKAMQMVGTTLSFSVDDITKRPVVKVLNSETHEVIRQIPPENMLKVSERIAELLGILYDHAG